MWLDPSLVELGCETRSVSFENPGGARGAGGSAHGGRKGAPARRLEPGERVVLADLDGPGTLRHLWLTFPPMHPARMRSLWIEVFYDGADFPSVSVPFLDFVGLPHGRPVAYASQLTVAAEGQGFNAYFPMPFREHVRLELENGADIPFDVYYQLDLTLEREPTPGAGYLHVSFRRENPTTPRRDFVIADGVRGPGRFLGCVVGVRPLDGGRFWYGEGEVKMYLDGDHELPTVCGTGLEDYVGSAWGMGAHAGPYAGAPLVVASDGTGNADWVGFYRWHVPDPVVFEHDLRVTIQQIGFAMFLAGEEDAFTVLEPSGTGPGWMRDPVPGLVHAMGIYERSDDYSAAAFVYAREPQPVPRLDPTAAVAGLDRLPHEPRLAQEEMFERPLPRGYYD